MSLNEERVRERFDQIRKASQELKKDKYITVLLSGHFGTRKTSFFKTCRLPVLLDFFDPPGRAEVLAEEVAEGKIIIRHWNADREAAKETYKKWEKQIRDDISSGFLSHFGTYGIDSGTTWNQLMLNYCVSTPHKSKEADPLFVPQRRDYLATIVTISDIIKLLCDQPTDLILTAHMEDVENSKGVVIEKQLMLPGKLKEIIPSLFMERWVSVIKPQGAGKTIQEIITAPEGMYKADSVISKQGTLLNSREEPDMKKMLAKAGYSTTDKPLWL